MSVGAFVTLQPSTLTSHWLSLAPSWQRFQVSFFVIVDLENFIYAYDVF